MWNFLSFPARRYLISGFFFICAISLILANPENGRFFYPLFFAAVVFLRDSDTEARFLLIFCASLTALIFPYFLKDGSREYPTLISQLLLFWAISYLSNEYYTADRRLKDQEREKRIKDRTENEEIKKRMEIYRIHGQKARERIKAGRILLSSLRELQSKTSSQQIMSEIKKALSLSFSDCVCEIKTRIDSDVCAKAAYTARLPILVKNSSNDPRFRKEDFRPEEGSIIAVPIIAFSSVTAVAKITSPARDRLNESDLRTCELLLRSAAIGLENLSLFSQINELAMKDALTGLLTHRAFQDRLDAEILTSGRTKQPFSLIIADIDHFKKYNDTYGHQAGDEVLRKTASYFLSSLREIDICARYGGEEFALILPQAALSDAVKTAETIKEGLQKLEFYFNGISAGISASFGVACFPVDAATKSQLIRSADERLYRAKKNGRNRVQYE
ncbi:MAG: hypothetical protein Fur0012_03720 [Elusimicrobiota bacterium]